MIMSAKLRLYLESHFDLPRGNHVLTELAAANSLVLEADLGPKAVSELHAALLARRGHAIVVDASNVDHIGGRCLQLLLSAKLTWASDEQGFSLVSPSQSMKQALELTGLDTAFSGEHGAMQ